MKIIQVLRALPKLAAAVQSLPTLMEIAGITGKLRDRKFGFPVYAEYNYKGGYSAGTNTGIVYTPGALGVTDIKLDFAAIAAARTAAAQADLAAADILNLFGVLAGTWIIATAMQVTTVEGATATVDIGDGSTAAGFQSNSSLNSAAWTSSLATTDYSVAVGGGKIYTADDTVDMTLDHNSINVAVAHVFAVSLDLRSYRD